MKKSFFIKILLLVVAIFISILIINILVPFFCQNCQPGFISQAAKTYNFDIRYIYWGKPNCDNSCKNNLESISTSEIVRIGEDFGDCNRVLVLGDSFTDSPWDGKGKSYAEHFLDNLAESDQNCYELIRLAVSGSGSDQQFARFSDVVDLVGPNLVIWQFYYNDVYDNAYKPLYEEKNGNFNRINAWNNAYFWAGWLYQNTPFLKNSNLGNLLLYFGELKNDLKLDWRFIESDYKSLIEFNEKRIAYFLKEMKVLEKKQNFKLITTLSPLECQFVYQKNCQGLSGQVSFEDNFYIQNELKKILQQNSSFISMYENDNLSEEQILNIEDFWKEEKEIGARHLGANGQEKVGRILFLNFIENQYDAKN